VVKTFDDLLLNNALAVEMVINVLSERGFTVGVSRESLKESVSVDLTTGAIKHKTRTWYEFTVGFPPARK
jgi:3-isopropylmalate dehydratase small subunit